MELDKKERALFYWQFELLKRVAQSKQDVAQFESLQRIVANGWEYEYSQFLNPIYEGLTAEECREVIHILDMFWALQRADAEALKGIESSWLKFAGFDGNDSKEASYAGYAEFLVEHEKKFAGVTAERHDPFNSHMPVLAVYRRMLSVWEKFSPERRQNLQRSDVESVVAVAGKAG